MNLEVIRFSSGTDSTNGILINKTNNRFINFLLSFLIPFKLKEELKNTDLIKTNQLNGSWVGIILKFMLITVCMLVCSLTH